jgi:hypothetical protein
LSDKPITREVSQNWNTHVSYAEDGSAVEVVLLEARANGAYPLEGRHARAAWVAANQLGLPSMTTMNISLSDTLKQFVDTQVAVACYGTSREHVR